MRYLLLAFSLLTFFTSAQAQNPVWGLSNDTTAIWVERFYSMCGDAQNGGTEIIKCDVFVMKGDTLMPDGNTWKMLWLQDNTNWVYPNYFACIREDSLKKVWLWEEAAYNPFVLYDFSLQLNDTFTLHLPIGKIHAKVEKDTIYYGRRTLTINTWGGLQYTGIDRPFQWAEGTIGSSHGFIYYAQSVSDRTCMIMKHTTFLSYKLDTVPPECVDFIRYIPGYVSAPTISPQAAVRVYPNPANSAFTIQIPDFNSEDAEFVLQDVTGRIVKTNTVNTPQTEVACTDLPRGNYFWHIRRKNGTDRGRIALY